MHLTKYISLKANFMDENEIFQSYYHQIKKNKLREEMKGKYMGNTKSMLQDEVKRKQTAQQTETKRKEPIPSKSPSHAKACRANVRAVRRYIGVQIVYI